MRTVGEAPTLIHSCAVVVSPVVTTSLFTGNGARADDRSCGTDPFVTRDRITSRSGMRSAGARTSGRYADPIRTPSPIGMGLTPTSGFEPLTPSLRGIAGGCTAVHPSPRRSRNSLQDAHISVDCSDLVLTPVDRLMYAESTRAMTAKVTETHRDREPMPCVRSAGHRVATDGWGYSFCTGCSGGQFWARYSNASAEKLPGVWGRDSCEISHASIASVPWLCADLGG